MMGGGRNKPLLPGLRESIYIDLERAEMSGQFVVMACHSSLAKNCKKTETKQHVTTITYSSC